MKRIFTAAAFCAAATAAHAADKPAVGPPPSWVRPLLPTPAPAKGSEGAAVAILQQDTQVRFDAAGQSQYDASQIKVQSAGGLAALGTIAMSWSPATDTLTVHRLRILRGGQEIDLLPKDGAFTAIRRESQLESAAMVNGVLTAVIQPEGLQVGDVLDVAYTLRREDPLLRGRADALTVMAPAVPIAHARTIAFWPTSLKVAWKAVDGMPAPVVTDQGGETTAMVDVLGLQPQPTPDGAPPRFKIGRQLMFSNYAAWADVSALMEPLYAEAMRLPPGSPVAAQARAIAARTADPAARASAALALVQDEVRYLALVQGELGLKPAAADLTWSRRYGDCKGKTVLLLALLKELGIEAEPALAGSALGDGLDGRLPAASVFDHVLVRAKVGGRDYWLDGTRIGDRDLASISTPAFGFVLPVRASGASLVHLTPEPAKVPLARTAIRIDASKGIDRPAPFHVETTFRGDSATALKLQLANLAPDDLDRALKGYWRGQYDFVSPSTVSASFDPKAGEERLVMDGEAKLDWSNGGYEADGANLGWRFDPHRDPGPHADAPFAVAFPFYSEGEETMLLPEGGRGFSVWGEDVDKTLAGSAFHRKGVVAEGEFRLETSVRALTPEITLVQAQKDAPALSELSKGTMRVRAPGQATGVADTADGEPKDRDGYIARGNARLNGPNHAEAIADFNRAVALDPKSAVALAARGYAYAWFGDAAKAEPDLAKAEAIDPRQILIWSGRGMLAARAGRYKDALTAFDKALAIDSSDTFALRNRAKIRFALGDLDGALADSATELAIAPYDEETRPVRAAVFARRKDWAGVRREAGFLWGGRPGPDHDRAVMDLYAQVGDKADLRAAADALIAKTPTAHAYILRASSRDPSDGEGIEADLKAALALEPGLYEANISLARLRLHGGDRAGALGPARKAAEAAPDDVLAAAVLAQAGGDQGTARRAFARAREKIGGDAALLNNLCYSAATANFDLSQALADCDASLKLRPEDAATLDSRAFVLLRLGRDKEALAAYDASLAARPDEAASLYGRSLAERRLGDAAAADKDLKAARDQNDRIEKTFTDYGVTR